MDDNDDLFLSSASRGTSPIDSGNDDDDDTDIDVVYEVDDSDDNDEDAIASELEKPAESAQAELSTQITLYAACHSLFVPRSSCQRLDFTNLRLLQSHAAYRIC
jgi:hypothetical protein